ncbi:MAG: hypothetical protein K2R93_02175 [Gemmatimonadaceae bacterium]|nr:hypothetical protein [Gemmatimonadaceae bacterium]
MGTAAWAVVAFAAVGVALFHGVALAVPSVDPASPPWRHALFLVLALSAALVLGRAEWRRQRWVAPLFALVTLQQLQSHGARLIRWWQQDHRVDWSSLVLLVTLMVLLPLLVRARRESAPVP